MKARHLAFVTLLVSAAACDRRAPMVRTEPDPILDRVQLPPSVQGVVWTAEPVVREGCIPAHDSPTRIHAFIAGYQGKGTSGHVELPLPVAKEILPASLFAKGIVRGNVVSIEGGTLSKNDLERPEKAQVRQAVVTAEGLVLELWVP
jgi:hypothetical protein